MRRLVKIVPLDSVKMVKDKLRASNAALVNSTIFRVLLPVNYVSTRLTLVEKEETVVALNARLDGLPITAVLNVKSVTPPVGSASRKINNLNRTIGVAFSVIL